MSRIVGGGRYGRETYPNAASAAGANQGKVRVNAADSEADYLEVKAIAGSNITLTPVDLGGGFLALSIAATVPPGSSDHKVLVDGADTTAAFLAAKFIAGAAIALAILSPGGDEQISVSVSNLSNAQVAVGAAIDGSKIVPAFGAQSISTTGTLNAGATTVSGLTASSLGLGVVHSSVGGALSSSLVVNADVSSGAAIIGTKIVPNFGAQAISTLGTLSAGATTVSDLTISSFIAGIVHSDAAGVLTSSQIVNADVAAAAAIAGSKINPNFGSQTISTTGLLNVGAGTLTGLIVSSLGLGVVHSSAGGVFSSSPIVNADVDAAAGIAGTKIAPNFGAQTVQTTGPLDVGAATATGLTVSGLGLGLVHSSAGGVFSSSLLVNADVSGAAAIAVAKLAPGINGQVLTTTAGAAAWGFVPATGLTPGAANTVLVTNGAATATQFSLLVNANVDSAAAIAGTKINPDFGSQVVTTTGSFVGNSATAFLRLGLVAGSGAGVASAASAGAIRGARGASVSSGGTGFSVAVRNDADTADVFLARWDSTGPTLNIGQLDTCNINLISTTNVDITPSSNIRKMRVATGAVTIGGAGAFSLSFASGVVLPSINQGENIVAGGTGQLMLVQAQNARGTGTVVAGVLRLKGGNSGDAGSPNTDGTAGDVELIGGDASNGTTTNIAANAYVAGGTATGTGAVQGNVALITKPVSYQSMERGVFLGNVLTVPAADPASGVFVYSNTAKPEWRFPTNQRFRFNGVSASAAAGAGGALPATVEGYWDVQINGTQRKIPYYAA